MASISEYTQVLVLKTKMLRLGNLAKTLHLLFSSHPNIPSLTIYSAAMHSISTSVFFGRVLTATHLYIVSVIVQDIEEKK